jgi:hypothetical protein
MADGKRACAYCDNEAVPGLPHHNGWPVCAEHAPDPTVMRALSDGADGSTPKNGDGLWDRLYEAVLVELDPDEAASVVMLARPLIAAELARVRTDATAEIEKAIRGVYGVAQDPDHALDLALAAVRGVNHEH